MFYNETTSCFSMNGISTNTSSVGAAGATQFLDSNVDL